MRKIKNLLEQALSDEQQVYLKGGGTWTVGSLKKNVSGKLDDLKRRVNSGELYGISETQLELVSHMILTLKAAEDGETEGPDYAFLNKTGSGRATVGSPSAPTATPSKVTPFRKQ